MKKLSFLYLVLLLVPAILFTSCEKEGEVVETSEFTFCVRMEFAAPKVNGEHCSSSRSTIEVFSDTRVVSLTLCCCCCCCYVVHALCTQRQQTPPTREPNCTFVLPQKEKIVFLHLELATSSHLRLCQRQFVEEEDSRRRRQRDGRTNELFAVAA